MRHFLLTIAGVFAGLMLFAIIAPIMLVGAVALATRPAPLAARSVLVLDLRGALVDQDIQAPIAIFSGHGQSVMGIEETLRRARGDGAVRGLLVRLPEGGVNPAAADELRLAFKAFRAAGKPILAVSQGLYAQGPVTSTYELAAASGDIWMQPGSAFQVTGFSRQDIFFKRFFDHHQIQPDFQQRYEYKNAVNPYLFDGYTPAHREGELSWMGSVYATSLAAAAIDRSRPLADLKSAIEAGPWSAGEAVAKGLIDHAGGVREAQNAILAKAGPGAALVSFDNYAARRRGGGPSLSGGQAIAVISGEGDIMTGGGGVGSPFGGGPTIRSDDIARAFDRATRDPDVKAIVFRISSPGGSDTASEQILTAVRAARAAGKPVVVSMGAYGASGGYWIASQASEIVAQPGTLTGSIGVFGGKFAFGPALAQFGVDMDGLKVGGDYADALSSRAPMTPTQRAAFSAWMDRIYQGFIGRVAAGRRLPVARVEEIAKGRVWTGAQARDLGLVDSLGGFPQAVERAKALAGIRGLARLESFNIETSPIQALRRMFGTGAQGVRAAAAALDFTTDPRAEALLGSLRDARLRANGATVLAPRAGW